MVWASCACVPGSRHLNGAAWLLLMGYTYSWEQYAKKGVSTALAGLVRLDPTCWGYSLHCGCREVMPVVPGIGFLRMSQHVCPTDKTLLPAPCCPLIPRS